jgi:hypothetical protein
MKIESRRINGIYRVKITFPAPWVSKTGERTFIADGFTLPDAVLTAAKRAKKKSK